MTTYSFQQMTPYRDMLTDYIDQLGGDVAVLARIAAAYSVNEVTPAAMSVIVGAGAAFRDGNVVEVAARTTPTVTAPSGNPRIDRVVLNPQTDALLVVQGIEATSPVPPQIPAGYLPLAKIALTPATMAITNAAITDERLPIASTGPVGGGLIGVQTFTSSGTYTPTPGTNKIVVRVVGGGGSGGSCTATSSGQGSAASGGGAGAYAEALLTSGFAGVTVSIGAGGLPAAIGNNAGNIGGTSSFGTAVTAPGGTTGYGSPALSPPFLFGGTGTSATPTGGNIVSAPGQTGEQSVALAPNAVVGGIGGSSVFGAGGRGAGWGDGFAGQGPGAGGGGACGIASQTGYRGGAGAAGIVIVTEFA